MPCRPYGPLYTSIFGRLMLHFKFTEHVKDSGDRARLVEVMENLPAIEQWRNGLTDEQRREWNHPTTVLRRYKAAKRAEVIDEAGVFKPPTLTERNKVLRAEIHQLRKGAPLPWAAGDTAADKARAVMEHLSIVEAEELGLALLQAVKDARGPATDDAEPTDPEPTAPVLPSPEF
jgi:hypothetical protein